MPENATAAAPEARETVPAASQPPRHVPPAATRKPKRPVSSAPDTPPPAEPAEPKAAAQETPAPQPEAAPAAPQAGAAVAIPVDPSEFAKLTELTTDLLTKQAEAAGIQEQTTYFVTVCMNDSRGDLLVIRARNPKHAAYLAGQQISREREGGIAHLEVMAGAVLHSELADA